VEIDQLTAMAWFSRAVSVAARLGIADVIGDGSMSYPDIAKETDCDPDAVLRLMQVLVLIGVCARDADGSFRLLELAARLRSDHPQSMRYFCILAGETYNDVWGGLLHTVRTGKSAAPLVLGEPLYRHLENNPEAAAVYDKAMEDLARPVAAELVKCHDFSSVRRVVDVGGGNGAMLRGILAEHPHLDGVSADRADVCARAVEAASGTARNDITRRLSFVPSDFFAEVPAGGDRYLLKNVLHNWSFTSSVRVLSVVREAMNKVPAAAPRSRLLVVEPLIEREEDGWRALFQMVVCEEGTHGMDGAEMRTLLDTARFDVLTEQRLATGHNVFECAPRTD
jgi:hypothetical protein